MEGPGRILALAGGVGGAKLAHGLAAALEPDRLLIAVNTGDDFEHLGFKICPDLDTVMYTLAGRANPATGWGLAGETWSFIEAIGALGGETWFRLGDRDLATHVARRQLLDAGKTLSEVTATLSTALGIAHEIAPMSDDPVRTMVATDQGRLAFQDYFVRRRCEPRVRSFEFKGIERALPSPALAAVLEDPDLAAIVICPSNPYVSVAPIIGMPAVAAAINRRAAPIVAVSPIVGGAAIKGPAAKMMKELGAEPSAAGVARFYGERIDAIVIDEIDSALAPAIARTGLTVHIAQTIMRNDADRRALAETIVALARTGMKTR